MYLFKNVKFRNKVLLLRQYTVKLTMGELLKSESLFKLVLYLLDYIILLSKVKAIKMASNRTRMWSSAIIN